MCKYAYDKTVSAVYTEVRKTAPIKVTSLGFIISNI